MTKKTGKPEADKKGAKATKGEKPEVESKDEKKPRKKSNAKATIFLVGIILVGLVFLPTSVLLFIGMMPTMVSFLTSVRRNRTRTSTIAAMNLMGCMPFIIKLWGGENTFAASIEILTNPLTIIIIYGAAVSGYVIDWVVVGVVSSFLYQKAQRRLQAIKDRQDALIEEWGEEVSGQKRQTDY